VARESPAWGLARPDGPASKGDLVDGEGLPGRVAVGRPPGVEVIVGSEGVGRVAEATPHIGAVGVWVAGHDRRGVGQRASAEGDLDRLSAVVTWVRAVACARGRRGYRGRRLRTRCATPRRRGPARGGWSRLSPPMPTEPAVVVELGGRRAVQAPPGSGSRCRHRARCRQRGPRACGRGCGGGG
jgi:hypothetical protein